MKGVIKVASFLTCLASTILIGLVIFWLVDGTRGIDWSRVGITALVLGAIHNLLEGR